ncbi:hypothetical protein [Aureispira anguillae]|uniref:Right handed beta helix domain-containing protein n=1 Tax=Aureispira anguillae TaxID=2864201 RepID=A0A916DW12_9BACT|nr:hypothetical protein [Aureispira anguillae]BDS14292.1 hypothetical protein AsAng_0050710 [Aureispira anguillae]
MKSIIKKILFISLPLTILSFGACRETCISPCGLPCDTPCICDAEVINDPAYFKTNRVLTNNCTTGDGIDYIVEATTVANYYDVTTKLTVEKGTTILFKDGAGLAIKGTGSISAIGEATEMITFRGEEVSDEGAWRGVYIETDQTDNNLEYVHIQGAGGESFNSNDDKGNLVIYADAKVSVKNCRFSNSTSYGVNSNYTSADLTSLLNNTFENNNIPILIRGNHVDIVDATNTFLNNTNSYVHVRVGSEIKTSKIWQALSIPYRITSSDFGIFKHQEVGSNGKLTINAGTTIEFETQTGFKIDDTATFLAVGTANNRIKFRGANPVAGSWDGIQFNFTQSPSNEIAYADIEHAGSENGAIYMWADPFVNVHDVSLSEIPSCAFFDAPKSPQDPTNPRLTRNNINYTNVGSQYCKGN